MLEMLEARLFLSRTWFVSPSGSDQSLGTISQPFKTIQHAAGLAQAGDTVYLRAGTYRETVTPAHSGTSAAPITYSAYNNELVTIDGADPITGWADYSKSIYDAPQPFDLGAGNNEVFVDGKAMNEAQWPNTAIGAVKPATASITSVYSSAIGTADGYADTATIAVSGLPGGPTAWLGAAIHFGAGQAWTIQTGTVIDASSTTLTFAYQHQTNYETPAAGNRIYLTGKFNGLDAAGEWYRDPSTGKLYLWTPKGDSPASHLVEAKHRQYAFELSGLSYINIRNVHIFAASIDTNSRTNHVNISGITASYVSQQMINPIGWINDAAITGIMLLGSNNILQSSTIQYSSGNGVYLGGSDNIVQSCAIANTDYSGVDEAAITLVGQNNQILSCTIHDTGRDGILDSDATNARIEFNKIYNIGNQTTDLGAIYDYGTDSHGTIIASNTISNVHTGGFGGDGIYLDNGSADYIVHNNTISSVDIPIKLNPPTYSNSVYNNIINGKLIAKTNSAGGTPASGPATYKGTSANFTTLGTLGGFKSSAAGINGSGEVVGNSMTGTGNAAFYYAMKMNAIGSAAGANAVNSAGQIVGSTPTSGGPDTLPRLQRKDHDAPGFLPGDSPSGASYAINTLRPDCRHFIRPDGIGRAFLYGGGAVKALGTLGGKVSEAFGINNAGTVIGAATLPGDRDERAFAWFAGTMTDLGTLGGSSSYALGINNAGQIVGTSLISGNGAFHAFLYSGGTMHNLGTLSGFKNAVATGIDSAGDVVGYAYNSDTSQSHAFLYRKGAMVDLNNLIAKNTGWTLTSATGINDNKQIIGTAGSSDLRNRAYLLTLPT